MTIRVHHYTERDGFSVCKYCGSVQNKDVIGPRWCPGQPPQIGLREALIKEEQDHLATLAGLDELLAAAREVVRWDWSHLLVDHPDAAVVLRDVAALEAEIQRIDGVQEAEGKG
jgi:hypothetical protein